MSKSFKIENGDFVISGRSYATVAGKDKLFQDLKLWILERIGTDPATPTYGSTLDGGVINGQLVESMIGQSLSQGRIDAVKAEVSRLLEQYQQNQVEKMRLEVIEFRGSHTLSPDEILYQIESIDAAQLQGDTILVRVACKTLAGTSFSLTIPTEV